MSSSGMDIVFYTDYLVSVCIIESLLDWIHVLYLTIVELNYNGLELYSIDNGWCHALAGR